MSIEKVTSTDTVSSGLIAGTGSGENMMALGRFNGSRGQAAYPKAVLAAQQGWQ